MGSGCETLRFCEGTIRRTLRSSVKESLQAGLGTTAAFYKLRVSGCGTSPARLRSFRPCGSSETGGRRLGNLACSLRGMPMNFDVEIGSTAVARPWVPSWDPGRDDSLIASLLTEQGDLSAVERFAQFHEHADEPLQGRYYSRLDSGKPARPRPATRLRGGSRPLFGLQGVRGGLPRVERAWTTASPGATSACSSAGRRRCRSSST